jgi:hypothetical protein
MGKILSAFLVGALAGTSHSFAPHATFRRVSSARTSINTPRLHAYVPDGLSPEEYRRIKDKDSQQKQGKDLGRLGPKGFKSRSLQGWQQAFEKGQAAHTFAPVNYKDQVKSGSIRREDVPYMVRGGEWDNGDVPNSVVGAKRLRWSKHDREYAHGGYKKEQSASLLGSGPGLNWTGKRRPRKDDEASSKPGFG